MIAYTVLLLFFIGIFSSIKVGVKVDKFLALTTFASVFLVFANFWSSMHSKVEHTFSFAWNASQVQNLQFEIISNPYNYTLGLPFFLLTIIALLNNILFRNEERRSVYSAVLVFNLIALILLISSNNFMQLISALFVVDILALLMISNDVAGKRYAIMNLLADMILFTMFAVINSRVDSLDFSQILRYQRIGFHMDFVAFAGLTAIFMKFGFCVLQIGIMGLKETRMHRIQNVMFLSSAATAMILLLKLSSLWNFSAVFIPYLTGFCTISMIWGGLGSLAADNTKEKLIYWMMMFWSFMLILLRFNEFAWQKEFTALIVEMYLFCCTYYLIYYYNNRLKQISKMMQIKLVHKKQVAAIFGLLCLIFTVMANTLLQIYDCANRYFIWGFAGALVLTVAAVLRQIYFAESKRQSGIQHNIKFKWTETLMLAGLCLWLLWSADVINQLIWICVPVFMALCAFSPLG